MSDSGGGGGGGGPGRREVAYRLFAAEYDDADLSYSESDEERAPNYVVTPSGARVNRLFVVGVLTEVENVSEDYLRARVVDPTGPFVIYAGQYQPEAMRFLESAEPPTFVAVTGKARTFQPEDSDRVYTSIRPESINEVDADTRDRWVIQAAEGTIERVARMAEATESGLAGDDLEASLLAHGVEEGLASGIPLALEHYGTTGEYLDTLRQVAIEALEVVAGERDEVTADLPDPDHGGDGAIGSLAEETIEPVTTDVSEDSDEAEPEPAGIESEPETTEGTEEPETTESEDAAEPQVATAEGGTTTESESSAGTATENEPSTDAAPDASSEELGDFDGDFDIDEEEREEIESEYGTEFKSGTEVEEPGEADIDTPDPEETVDVEAEPAAGDVEAGEPADEPAPTESVDEDEDVEVADEEPIEDAAADDSAAEDTDDEAAADEEGEEELDATAAEIALDDAVVDAMADLDDGDGADRSDVVGEVVDRTGADPGDVEDAIQDALMDGLCYEPADGTLKPI